MKIFFNKINNFLVDFLVILYLFSWKKMFLLSAIYGPPFFIQHKSIKTSDLKTKLIESELVKLPDKKRRE